MGKRSNFERIEKDQYQTIDKRAVMALLPHLKKGTFVEPCAGEYLLVNDLEDNGMKCTSSSDILTDISKGVQGRDALTIDEEYCKGADYIITNPPWTRDILHEMIIHFSNLRPTWLLFDADWMHTKQSSEYMKRCRKIVSVGRLRWIPGTSMVGKDNCCWYLFNRKEDYTEFVGR